MATRKHVLSKVTALTLTAMFIISCFSFTALAGDTWPFTGAAAPGANQPNVHGYTSGQIADWSPMTDPGAAMLRSFVPLQTRIAPFAATQANPLLPSDAKMFNLAGDYGNAFIENAAYTNKFAQNHFGFWQYTDFFSPWHGTASAYTPPEYYDALGQADWQQKWFEFGILNIPNPTYTDAAHKNGVMSLACIFFSNGDRGQQTYKQMLVKDADGTFPVAVKLVEMAKYFGYDGYFINQEEVSPNVQVADIPDYIAFLKALRAGGVYVQWYDSLNTSTGANSFARVLADSNINMLYDKTAGEQVSDSFFLDYTTSATQAATSLTYLNNFNTQNGTNLKFFDTVFAGLEGGRDRWSTTLRSHLAAKVDASGFPKSSLAALGTDFVHAGLDEDMGLSYPVDNRHDNNFQWMTNVRERLWWSGPNQDPTNTVCPANNAVSDVYADNRNWRGIASVISERSVISGANFYTAFSTGHGLRFYRDGAVSNNTEWSNMSLQDIPLTWQWWQTTTGTRLAVDNDYGTGYKSDPTRQNYIQLGGFNSGNSLVVSGKLDAENTLRLYKTELDVNAGSTLGLTYNKPTADDASVMKLALIFKDAPAVIEKIAIPNSGRQTQGWTTANVDLSAYAGRKIATIGLVFDPNGAALNEYQMNIGQLRLSDGSAPALAAPANLSISDTFSGSNEMTLRWDRAAYSTGVRLYNVYVNDVYVGGKYDAVYYIKNLPARSGTVSVAPVGADGREGAAATRHFDLTNGIVNVAADSKADGTFTVTWTNVAYDPVIVWVDSVNLPAAQQVHRSAAAVAGNTSLTFFGLPVNGDDYVVTLKSGARTPVSLSGRFIDTVCEPYAENWSWSGDVLSLPMPNTRDWRYIYVYEDGQPRSFLVTYLSNNTYRPMIIRGRSTKACLSFSSTAKFVYLVMEDYTGNKSAPLVLRDSADMAAFFPDPVLRGWVETNVGLNLSSVAGFTGTVDLTGLDIRDFTGLAQFANVRDIIIASNPSLTMIDKNVFPMGLTTLRLKNNPNLRFIRNVAFAGLPSLKTLDITGNAALQFVSLTGLPLETLVYGDKTAFPSLVYLDITDTGLDVSRGASVRDFANYILVRQVTPTGSVVVPVYANQARGLAPTGFTNAVRLTDGNLATSSYANATVPANAVIDFGTDIKIEQVKLYATSATYLPKNFALSVSSDNSTFTEIGAVSNSSAVNYTGDIAPAATARYLKLSVTATGSGTTCRLAEMEVYGIKNTAYAAAVKYDGMLSRAALKELCDSYALLKPEPYSIQSWAAFQTKLDAAKAVLNALDPTQEEMDNAARELTAARGALVNKLTKLKFATTVTTVKRGRTLDLSAMLAMAPLVEQNWSFTALNTAVASVDENGVVTAVKAGLTAVLVKALDGSGLTTQIVVSVIS